MPSDPLVATGAPAAADPRAAQALTALARPIGEFRAAVQGALDQAARALAAQAEDAAARAARARIELGVFADGRIDAKGFAALQGTTAAPLLPAAADALDRAVQTLREVLDAADRRIYVNLPPGSDLATEVAVAYAELGRAFGAVLLTELVRGGQYDPTAHDHLLQPLAFDAWTRVERRFSPPLIIELDGADLAAGALAEYLDGQGRILLIVRGPAAPAPLARLITPGTFVMQTVDRAGLERVALADGPAIGALMPDGSAVFTHDPAGGKEAWQRLSLGALPTDAPRKAIGGTSAWQMNQDLTLLAEMARTPFAVPRADGSAAPALGANDAVDRIAQWLLGNTELPKSAR